MYTIQLDGENLHYYWNNAYGWGAISSTDNKNGSPVLFESQSEAEEWISGKLVFCKGAKVIEIENKKRGRGRPSTGAALTPAEKQKAYRERQKASGNVTDKDSKIEELEKVILERGYKSYEMAEKHESEIQALLKELLKAKERASKAEEKLKALKLKNSQTGKA